MGRDRSPPRGLIQGGRPLFLLLRALLGGWFRMMGCILLTMGLGLRVGNRLRLLYFIRNSASSLWEEDIATFLAL